MAASPEYTKEQLNYYRICYVTTDILTEGLRSVFKQEWDNRYKATLGEWKDDPKSGMDFYNSESPRNQKRNAHLLVTITNGVRAQWDCTMLFYAILYSDCIGRGLDTAVKTSVDVLRKFRNEEFAHMPRGFLTDADFQNAISQVRGAFQSLGLSSSTNKIDDVKNQTSFPTEELSFIMKKVDDLEEELRQEKQQRKVLEDQLEKEISPFCVLPPKPSHHVTERNREANEITKQLKQLKEANKNDISYLYISGNPGSGKSQLAGLVARRFFDEAKAIPSAAPCVMTLNAASPDSLLESYASFVRQLRCPELSVTNTLNSRDIKIEQKIANLKTLVATKIDLYTTWLLVVDNVSSMSWVHAYLPERGNEQWSNGQVLITTQDVKSIPSTNSFVKHLSISRGMDVDDACLLLAMLSGISDCEMGKEAAKTLDYQPLALASAATFVNQVRQNKATSNFHWVDYLEKVQKGQRSTTEEFLEQSNLSYPRSMTSATKLAVKNAMFSDKIIDQTFTLLSLCSSQLLSLDIVNSYIIKVDEQAADKESICMRIKRCSLVLFEEDEDVAFIRVHQVVHDAIKNLVKEQSGKQKLHQTANAAVTSFCQFIDTFPEYNRQCADTVHIVPHLKAFIMIDEPLFSGENACYVTEETRLAEYVDSYLKCGVVCTEHCEFHIAGKYYESALSILLKHVSPNHITVALIYDRLGSLHRRLGDIDRAKEFHNRALEIKLKKVDCDHFEVADTYSHLGFVHLELGDHEQAKEYQDRALTIYLKKLSPDHVFVARSYGNLGFIHENMGELESAKKYLGLALEIQLKACPDHPDVATTYTKLGVIHQTSGDLERAKEYQDRALAIRVKKLGPDHTDVATSYSNLGNIYQQLGDLQRAKECQDRALAIRLTKQGPDHTDVATTYVHLGIIYLQLGDLGRAKEHGDHALAIYLQKLGPDHTYVATAYFNLGVIHQKSGDLESAKECQDRALAIRLRNLGPDHTDVATIYSELGVIHQQLGDLQQAKEYQDRALAIRLKKLGPDHTDVATTYSKLGVIHQQLGDLQQAKEYQDRALAIRLKKLGPDHTDVATIYAHMGLIYLRLDDLGRAKEYGDHALAIYLQKFGPDHNYVATAYFNLGVIHQKSGDLESAKECQDRALAIRVKKLGPDHTDVATSSSKLGDIYQQLGDLQRAKEYQDRALAIRLKKLGPDHTDVATTYSKLGVIYKQLGDLQRAKEYQDCVLAIKLKKLGPDVATDYCE